ncbi:MAG: aspartyl/glutamyl-tRNA amidotransferase subunit A [Acidobacteria bacterium RIFCSPLOWO2_02_FULL_68_18]|nr:MAG: aspartyl/glutamyl-tRNA amidotransferase subunit A [Acidobacteria bacterium RIFCSPLOWO2_02_FULL_68_18]OFW51974.1 MAG: aspartyl/glutamyl-tRNA amidotransferase subunit A [Acidobacteria bacterium RIFCSPLOWO2_12_FULL_68_19]
MLDASARAIRDEIARGRATAVNVCRTFLDRIEAVNPSLNAFTLVAADRALARAADIDRRRAAGEPLGPLAGVPVAVKDNLCVRGVRTTASSRMLERFVPPYHATVVERLEAAGAVIVGKTNCDEFAMGSSNENSAFGPVRNPWATDRTPGGSSGGSAAAVAARCVPMALGSDTGGSIRQPAAFCGVVGLKPTYGRVSRYGLLAFASSLDQIGPIARNAADAALALAVLAGTDPADATSSRQPVPDFPSALSGDVTGLRLGVPRAVVSEGVDADVRRAFEAALDTLRRAGVALVDVELPHAKYAVPVYYLVATAEASSNLARYDGVRFGYRARAETEHDVKQMYSRTRDEGFGPEVKRRIMLGTYVLSAGYYDAYYLKAQQVRTLLRSDYQQAFESVDVVAMPTSPIPPFRLGEKTADPLQMYLADVFTVSANLAGLPAISIPCGFVERSEQPERSERLERLPVGLQLTGRMFDESTLLRMADAYERLTDWTRQAPSGPGVI